MHGKAHPEEDRMDHPLNGNEGALRICDIRYPTQIRTYGPRTPSKALQNRDMSISSKNGLALKTELGIVSQNDPG